MNKINLFFWACIILFLGTSCNKDAELIDDNAGDNSLDFKLIDSLKVKTSTIIDESADGKNLTSVLLGSSNDPRFGFSKAAFYAELSLTQNGFELGANPVLDSVVLILNQSAHYGSLNASFDLNVYELNHTLDSDFEYDNNSVLNVKSPPLANISNFNFSSVDDPLRIKLNDTFGNNLLAQFGTSTLESSANFKNYFNGIYVTATSTNGDGFSTLALKNDATKIELFYHSDTQTDTSYSFVVESGDVTLNQYNHNSTGSEAELAANDSNTDEMFSYVSSMSSFKTLVSFPDMTFLEEVVINKAELSFYQADYSNSINASLPEMERLFLFVNTGDTSIAFLPDFSLNNPTPFGGTKELLEINGLNTFKYTFNITDYVQDLIKGNADGDQLYLNNISNNEGGRIKIGGGANSTLPVKLELLYTVKK